MLSDNKDLSKIKLIDFGLSAIFVEANTRFTGNIGTPIYLAPE